MRDADIAKLAFPDLTDINVWVVHFKNQVIERMRNSPPIRLRLPDVERHDAMRNVAHMTHGDIFVLTKNIVE